MRLALVVNSIESELAVYTTTRLSVVARKMGHEVWTIEVDSFFQSEDGIVHASARSLPKRSKATSGEKYLEILRGDSAIEEDVSLDDFDVVLLRNDPAADSVERPWAQLSPLLFAQLAVRRGVIVLNDPFSLANALNKTYFQHFPEEVRPRTLISRDPKGIKSFIRALDGDAVIKPLQGSGGTGVFLVRDDDPSNLNQMIEAISRDGYVVVQEYLAEARKGDVRLFVMNGQPLLSKSGEYAAFRRVNKSGDIRSNITAGGSVAKVEVTDEMLALVDAVRPKLIHDGLWFVGLDMVGDKLMEVNVFSPGGLGSAEVLFGVDFCEPVITSLERKLEHKRRYGRNINNKALATV
ncbi:MAG: glutathione synthase [Acidobacteria bacterium]|nr:glutathione synthase [Acidobacteriota bacterium]